MVTCRMKADVSLINVPDLRELISTSLFLVFKKNKKKVEKIPKNRNAEGKNISGELGNSEKIIKAQPITKRRKIRNS